MLEGCISIATISGELDYWTDRVSLNRMFGFGGMDWAGIEWWNDQGLVSALILCMVSHTHNSWSSLNHNNIIASHVTTFWSS